MFHDMNFFSYMRKIEAIKMEALDISTVTSVQGGIDQRAIEIFSDLFEGSRVRV